ncbi:ornithine decarboxylase antizyme [Metarhizium guizhouense ARSEF 977]|uniref:Ornithine decarboxylase antizyme n=1 Tax=Metarhizium guizhouense (strain ARSEF 977) TaxID=1276136 RepID=A0A0B4GL30_METGA|nr:ornithine decarboxylase antizyme [Metarhizium guizhouense ARSEF 977]
MALLSNQNLNCSSNYGEDVVARVNVLASCYIVDSAAQLKGIHYCTTGAAGLPSPPTSPPLAALTSSNELALLPKNKKRDNSGHRRPERRGGAALTIREECERFFCEPMKTAFHGERNLSMNGSGLSGAYLQTPPPESRLSDAFRQSMDIKSQGFEVDAWMEVWDYAGGASFRAFVANNGQEKSLFVFFDIEGVMGRDLKKALMALIELADGPLECAHIVTCIDRRIPFEEAHELTKSLQWVGFEMTTLDHWANHLDVTSKRWVFMGMEL